MISIEKVFAFNEDSKDNGPVAHRYKNQIKKYTPKSFAKEFIGYWTDFIKKGLNYSNN